MKKYVIAENGIAYVVGKNYHEGMDLEEAKQALEDLHKNWETDTWNNYTPIVENGTYFAQFHVSKKDCLIHNVKRYQVIPYNEAVFE